MIMDTWILASDWSISLQGGYNVGRGRGQHMWAQGEHRGRGRGRGWQPRDQVIILISDWSILASHWLILVPWHEYWSLIGQAELMHLMHLAEYPLDFNENIKNIFKWAEKNNVWILNVTSCFRNFKRSNNTLPKLSYIPTCFYGKKAGTYWSTRYVGAWNASSCY